MADTAVLVFGAGGHAKVVIDVFQASGRRVVACIAPDAGGSIGDIPILSESSDLAGLRDQGYRAAFVAIGDNQTRQREAARLRESGFQLINAVSPRAYVAHDVRLGTGVLIVHGAMINAASHVGDDTIINTAATVDHDSRIESGVHIAPGSHLAGKVTVGNGAFLGIGTVVLPGVTVGRGAMIGAGSVVTQDVTAYHRAWGSPARDMGLRSVDHD